MGAILCDKLGELLRDTSDHMLMLTATPHRGDPVNFSLFLQLLDPDRRRRTDPQLADDNLATSREATTLDRVHAAMLLQAGGRTNGLRALIEAEQKRGADFVRLANLLAALYPKGSEDKRLLEAML